MALEVNKSQKQIRPAGPAPGDGQSVLWAGRTVEEDLKGVVDRRGGRRERPSGINTLVVGVDVPIRTMLNDCWSITRAPPGYFIRDILFFLEVSD